MGGKINESLTMNFLRVFSKRVGILVKVDDVDHLHIAIQIFHNTSATVVHISVSILGSKFWLVLQEPQHCLEHSCMRQGYIPLLALIEL